MRAGTHQARILLDRFRRRSSVRRRKEPFHVQFARKGGLARAKQLSSEQRRASASKAARARWAQNQRDVGTQEQPSLENAVTPDVFDLRQFLVFLRSTVFSPSRKPLIMS